MSTISAGTTVTNSLVYTGDQTGNLVLQVAGSNTAVTLDTNKNVTLANNLTVTSNTTTGNLIVTGASTHTGNATFGNVTVSGTISGTISGLNGIGGATPTGNVVLTSSSTGAQSITSTAYGQTVTLPAATTLSTGANLYNINNTGGYPLTILDNAGNILGFAYPYSAVIVGLASNSTAAGVWNLSGHELLAITAAFVSLTNVYNIYQVITLDSTRTLVILGFSTSTYGIIWDSSSQTFGTLTLISSTYGASTSYAFAAILTTTNQVLVCHGDGSTTLAAVVLTLSGTTITVGTYATATVTSINSGITATIIAQGSSWVFPYGTSSNINIVAITISGTTPTIGTPVSAQGFTNLAYISSISSSVLLAVTLTATTAIYVTPFTVSGTTITAGTGVTISTSGSAFRILPISSGARRVIAYLVSGGTIAGTVISVSGTTATISTATLATSTDTTISYNDMIVSGSKLIFHQNGVGFQILTDTSGTASVGTFLAYTPGTTSGRTVALSATNNIATFAINPNTSNFFYKVNINFSTASPTLSLSDIVYNSGFTNSVAWNITNTGSSGGRPYNALYGTVNIFIREAAIKYGMVNQGATLALATKFTTPAAINSATASFPGANNELWVGAVSIPPTIFRIQSIT